MSDVGRILMLLGAVLLVAGALLAFVGRVPRLPGDVLIRGEHDTIYIPIATSIALSLILTVLLRLFVRR